MWKKTSTLYNYWIEDAPIFITSKLYHVSKVNMICSVIIKPYRSFQLEKTGPDVFPVWFAEKTIYVIKVSNQQKLVFNETH